MLTFLWIAMCVFILIFLVPHQWSSLSICIAKAFIYMNIYNIIIIYNNIYECSTLLLVYLMILFYSGFSFVHSQLLTAFQYQAWTPASHGGSYVTGSGFRSRTHTYTDWWPLFKMRWYPRTTNSLFSLRQVVLEMPPFLFDDSTHPETSTIGTLDQRTIVRIYWYRDAGWKIRLVRTGTRWNFKF